jgi:hypothetical protein
MHTYNIAKHCTQLYIHTYPLQHLACTYLEWDTERGMNIVIEKEVCVCVRESEKEGVVCKQVRERNIVTGTMRE